MDEKLDNYLTKQKFLLINSLEQEVKNTGRLSKKTLEFIDFFYQWKGLSFFDLKVEFERMTK